MYLYSAFHDKYLSRADLQFTLLALNNTSIKCIYSPILRRHCITAPSLKTPDLKHGSFSIFICIHKWEFDPVSQMIFYAYRFKQWLKTPLSRCDRQIQKQSGQFQHFQMWCEPLVQYGPQKKKKRKKVLLIPRPVNSIWSKEVKIVDLQAKQFNSVQLMQWRGSEHCLIQYNKLRKGARRAGETNKCNTELPERRSESQQI